MHFTKKARLAEADRVRREREDERRSAVERLQRYAAEDAEQAGRERAARREPPPRR